MYAVIGLLRKHPSMNTEDFMKWWQEDHVPHVKRIPGVLHYVTYPIEEMRVSIEKDDFTPEVDVDGIAIIYYDSREAYHRALKSPEAKADKRHLQTGVEAMVYFGEPHLHVGKVVTAEASAS